MKKNAPKQNPLISVLIPTYNAGAYLRPALQSILRQTYSNLEIIIVDDGSTDDSIDTIQNLCDSRIVIIHQENKGKSEALNRALDKIKGDYWLVQDADDVSHAKRVEMLFSVFIENQKLAGVFSGHDLLIGKKKFAPTSSPLTSNQCLILTQNFRMPAHDATGMYQTGLIKDLRWDENLRIGEGLDFILRIGEQFPICRIGYCLYTYRINFQSLIRQAPADNIKWINKAIKKACTRRRVSFEPHCIAETSSNIRQFSSSLNHIVPHCMESVVDLKTSGNLLKAFETALYCLRISPLDYFFYKPLIYSLLPLVLIQAYRKRRMK